MSFNFRDDALLRYGFVRYYWTCIRHFGRQVWRSWRAEVFSSLGVSVIVFLIGLRLRDATALSAFEIALVANLGWLALFALWHLVRSPWLIYRDSEIRNSAIKSHRGWGVLGLAVLILMVARGAASCIWFYVTGQTRTLAVRYQTASTKDAEIMQLKQKLEESEKRLSKSATSFSLHQQQSGKNNLQTGPITQAAPCSVSQLGGVGNQATTNCGTVRSLTS